MTRVGDEAWVESASGPIVAEGRDEALKSTPVVDLTTNPLRGAGGETVLVGNMRNENILERLDYEGRSRYEDSRQVGKSRETT